MKRIAFVVCLWFIVVSASAMAQTKYSGTARCKTKSDMNYKIDVGDQPNHAFMLSQGVCDHIKPAAFAGIEPKQEIPTGIAEATGNTGRWQGFNIVTMANGDKMYLRTQCTSTIKPDGSIQNGECKITFVGGTGKFTGVKGEGISKGKAVGNGNVDWEYSGQYVLK